MIAISFLGTTNYQDTTYVYGDQAYGTRFFTECLPHFFPQIDQVLLFVTPTVQGHPNLQELQARMM